MSYSFSHDDAAIGRFTYTSARGLMEPTAVQPLQRQPLLDLDELRASMWGYCYSLDETSFRQSKLDRDTLRQHCRNIAGARGSIARAYC